MDFCPIGHGLMRWTIVEIKHLGAACQPTDIWQGERAMVSLSTRLDEHIKGGFMAGFDATGLQYLGREPGVAKALAQRQRSGVCSIHDGQVLNALVQQRPNQPGSCASGTDHQDAFGLQRQAMGPRIIDPTLAIGVGSNPPLFCSNERVYSACLLRRWQAFETQLQCSFFQWHRQVETAKPFAVQVSELGWKIIDGAVNGFISNGLAPLLGKHLMDSRRLGVADGVTQHRELNGFVAQELTFLR